MKSKIAHHSTLDEGADFYCTDKWQKKHHFKISSFSVGIKMLSEAIEVVELGNRRIPRVFHVLSDFDIDIEKAEFELKAKIMKWINQKHIRTVEGRLAFADADEIKGTIDCDDELRNTNFKTVFEIDGEKRTVEELVQLLEPYAAYKFRLQIIDSSEDFD